jgi:protein-disulfide isomerase
MKAMAEKAAGEVSDADAEAFFNENRARMSGEFDAMKDRIKEHLASQKQQQAAGEFVEGLKKKANVQTFLKAPRFEVAAGDSPRKGSASAPVEIIEFSDFQCPYCTRAANTVDEVVEKYGDKVSVVFKHFPLSFHDQAHQAGQASACANDQGKFWEYHDELFANQSALAEADLIRHAGTVALDVAAFTTCLTSKKHAATVDADMALGKTVGMSGTPGFYINGRSLSGAQPLDAFSKIIDEELSGS